MYTYEFEHEDGFVWTVIAPSKDIAFEYLREEMPKSYREWDYVRRYDNLPHIHVDLADLKRGEREEYNE